MTAALTLPARVERVIDGDTIEVSVLLKTHIRLRDCWAPEKNTNEGRKASENLTRIAFNKTGMLTIPYEPGSGFGQILTLGRVLGNMDIDGTDLSAAQVAGGFATEEKVSA